MIVCTAYTTYSGSHDALLCHGLDEDGDGRGYGLEGLECLNSASHQTVLTLWGEEEERDKERDRDRDRVHSLYSSCSKHAVGKHLTSSRQAVDKQWTSRGCTSRGIHSVTLYICRTGNSMKVLSLSNQRYQVTYILHARAAQPEMVALVGVSYFVLFHIQCLQSDHFIALLRAAEVNDLPLPHLPLQPGLCDTGSALHHLQLCVHRDKEKKKFLLLFYIIVRHCYGGFCMI